MDYVGLLTNKVEILFILIILGFILKKCGFLSDSLLKEMSVLMLKIFTTLASFSSFITSYTKEKAESVLLAIVVGVISAAILIIVANIVFRKEKYAVENFAIVCGNVGFFALPIVIAVYGNDAGMYASVYNAINGILMWTYGEYILSRDKSMISFKKAIKTTSMISFLAGLFFFFLKIPFPTIVKEALSSLSSVNSPMCAVMIGATLTGTELKEIKTDWTNLISIAIRLIVIPCILIMLMSLISNEYLIMKLSMLLVLSVPCAGTTPVFALRHNKDADKAARLTSFASLLCVITMPLMTNLALTIWQA